MSPLGPPEPSAPPPEDDAAAWIVPERAWRAPEAACAPRPWPALCAALGLDAPPTLDAHPGARVVCGLERPRRDGVGFVRHTQRRHAAQQLGALADAGVALLVVEGDGPLEVAPGMRAPAQVCVARLDALLVALLEAMAPARLEWDAGGGGQQRADGAWCSASARVHPSARLAPGARVGPEACVGPGARLGPGATVEPGAWVAGGAEVAAHAVVGWGCVVGPGARLGRGSVLGSLGFGTTLGRAPSGEPVPVRLPHVGIAVLEEGVEVGACATIDRAMVGESVVGAWSKLDNQVHLAHGVRLGRRCLVAAQVGIAGSTEVGDDVRFGGQAGVVGHVRIGAGAQVAAQAGVIASVEPGRAVAGTPAMELGAWRRAMVALGRLPGWMRERARADVRGDDGTK